MPTSHCRGSKGSGATSNAPTTIPQNLSLENLSTKLGPALEGAGVYAYIVPSIRISDGTFEQRGSGPNFEGNCITLCTCKHPMRAYKTTEEWVHGDSRKRAFWIAGFTSRTEDVDAIHWLAYLMKVGEAYASHYDLVSSLRRQRRVATLKAKFAHLHRLGDIFEPRDPSTSTENQHFSPSSYRPPIKDHSHENGNAWHKDINYCWRGIRRPALLVGDLKHSYRWTRSIVRTTALLPRENIKFSLSELLEQLEQ
jgi:hypothetical protein